MAGAHFLLLPYGSPCGYGVEIPLHVRVDVHMDRMDLHMDIRMAICVMSIWNRWIPMWVSIWILRDVY